MDVAAATSATERSAPDARVSVWAPRRSLARPEANVCSILPACEVEYREEPCRSALNRVKGMPFAWSLNPYMGCAHRCTFCYVRAFERRADRPSDDRYGRTIRVKTNVAEVLRARARAAVVARRGRRRSARRPTRTSRSRAATGSRARASRRSPRRRTRSA